MGAIFLSYAREDRAVAEKIAGVLEEAGHSVWWDRRIGGGEEFGAEIEAALVEANVVVVAWSEESVKSRWVRDEAAAGGDTGRLVPISIDGSQPPMGFRQFYTLDLTGWRGAKRDVRTGELLEAVERRTRGKQNNPDAMSVAEKPTRLAPPIKWLRPVAAALALLIAAGGLFLWINHDRLRGPVPKPTIAILPFTTASSDPQLRDLAEQARDSVSHTLPQIGIPVRLLNSVPQDRSSVGDFLLSADLSRSGDSVVATVRLGEVLHGVTVFSQLIKAPRAEISELPERVGVQVASVFNGWTLLILDRRRPMDPALIAELLAMGAGDELQAFQVAQRLVAQKPDVPQTQIALAYFTGFALRDLPGEERAKAVETARAAADRALQLAPEFGSTYSTWCFLHSETSFAECEDHLRTGGRIDPDAAFINLFLRGLLLNVGRFDEAFTLARLSYAHDPYDSVKIGQMLSMLEFSGDRDAARDLYGKAIRWYPDAKQGWFSERLIGLLEAGDFDAIPQLEKELGPDALPQPYRHSGTLNVNWKTPSAVKRFCTTVELTVLVYRCVLTLASLGDQDGAYAIADRAFPRRVGHTPAETERIWLDQPDGGGPAEIITSPGAAPMRRDPRYIPIAERTGLLAYWRTGRLPDFCTRQHEPICRQLLKHN
jgi:tetratricopeptide (TPR) repeat protein